MSDSQAPLIKCPHCHKSFPMEEALSHGLKEQIEKDYEKRLQDRELELKRDIEKKQSEAIKILEEEILLKTKRLEEAENLESQLRKQKLQLEDEKRSFEIEKQRQLDSERTSIRQKVELEMTEATRLKEKEKDKLIEDLKNALDDAQRKASQGSQQLQGEIAELDLEESLRLKFPFDVIEPVGKGIRGADLRHIVKTQLGNVCGVILWECKRTKSWSHDWTGKLKEDLRSEKANVPVIVSTVLPDEAKTGLGLVDGVWVCTPTLFLSLAEVLRQKLTEVAYQRHVVNNQSKKADILYQYIVSHEFAQQVEAIAEVYQEMQDQINKEKAAYERIWKTREGQIKRLVSSTASIVGSIRGAGASMPSIKGMDLPELEG